jgi:hypothetical protein
MCQEEDLVKWSLVNTSTQRMARAVTYNAAYNASPILTMAPCGSSNARDHTVSTLGQGVQVIATTLMRHSTCSRYVEKPGHRWGSSKLIDVDLGGRFGRRFHVSKMK